MWLHCGMRWVLHESNKQSWYHAFFLLSANDLSGYRNAQKGYKHVQSFCKQMKRSCGMNYLVLTFHQDEKGTIVLNSLNSIIPLILPD
jgi:hypothetical protein